ncbi:hypothetical protein ACWD6N_03685 [Micromonospora sp. NPDC005163]
MTALDLLLVFVLLVLVITVPGFALIWGHRRKAAPALAPVDAFDEHAATATALLQPDDPALPDVDSQLIALVVARAVDNYASYLIALRDQMPAAVLASLREQMYADLRESLTPPQLARALVIGLHPHADDRARALVDQFRSLPTTTAKESR